MTYVTSVVNARKNILSILDSLELDALNKGLVVNADKWEDELISLAERIGNNSAKLKEVHNVQIDERLVFMGNGVYFFNGSEEPGQGYWIRKKAVDSIMGKDELWHHLRIRTTALLRLKKGVDLPNDMFLPENFDRARNKVREHRRSVYKMKSSLGNIYIKEGSYKPSRTEGGVDSLRHISGMSGVTAGQEAKVFSDLGAMNVNVPEIWGLYEGPIESFLFMPEIMGISAEKALRKYKQEIIRQDAQMLARMLCAGYEKAGFADLDDKVFDGKKWWLIDADEVAYLYSNVKEEMVGSLLDIRDSNKLEAFRQKQSNAFKNILKDTIQAYAERRKNKTLLFSDDDKMLYAKAFFEEMCWPENETEISGVVDDKKQYFHPGFAPNRVLIGEESQGFR
ncbi:MAG: hypothetical protein ACP5N3_04345 [Candidatus Nanoarchaeia archaeon]